MWYRGIWWSGGLTLTLTHTVFEHLKEVGAERGGRRGATDGTPDLKIHHMLPSGVHMIMLVAIFVYIILYVIILC